jgi:dTDP-4-dehydrorhamnose 3,5-epimerase
MGAINVDQILVTPLRRIQVEGGDVLHGMKTSDPGYVNFGEVYFSLIEVGAIKAWKRHLRMTLNIVVPLGAVIYAFTDEQGTIREELVSENRYVRLTVPPGIWFGFKGLYTPYSIMMNVADIPHDPTEIERKTMDQIKYDWKLK